MTTCTVLDDKSVHRILINLSKEETIALRDELAKSLHDCSVSGERQYQPEPAAVNHPDGRKILFRTFTSQSGPGVKIIVDSTTAAPPSQESSSGTQAPKSGLHGILALCDEEGIPKGLVNADEITGYRASLNVMVPYLWRTCTSNVVVFGAGKQAL